MTVKEIKKSYKEAKRIIYRDLNGVDISSKPSIILDLMQVIGSSHNADGTIEVDVLYEE